MSFEVRKGHLDAAMTNCREWDNCLRYRGDQQLLDNIEFHNGNLKEADQVIKGQVDAVGISHVLIVMIIVISIVCTLLDFSKSFIQDCILMYMILPYCQSGCSIGK